MPKISAADKVLSNVANVGKELLGDLNGAPEEKGRKKTTETAKARKEGSRGAAKGGASGEGKGTPESREE